MYRTYNEICGYCKYGMNLLQYLYTNILGHGTNLEENNIPHQYFSLILEE